MSDLSKRNKANKRKGAQYETDLITYLREQGMDAERLRLTGQYDEGDIAASYPGAARVFVIEAKNTARHTLAEFVDESEKECRNYANKRGKEVSTTIPVVIMKRRNHGVDKSYVVMSLDTLLRRL